MPETVEEIARPPVAGGTVLSDTRHEIRPRSVTAQWSEGVGRKEAAERAMRKGSSYLVQLSLIRAM